MIEIVEMNREVGKVLNNKFKLISLVFLSLIFLIGCDIGEEIMQQTDQAIEIASTFVDHLHKGEYAEATQLFDQKFQEELSEEELAEAWHQITEQFGAYIGHEYKEIKSLAQYQVIVLEGTFAENNLSFEISFDENNKIAGFSIR